MSEKKIFVNCPTCKKKFSYYSSEFRPFCCERCKLIDMGHWYEESYSIAGRDRSVYIEHPQALSALLEDAYEDY